MATSTGGVNPQPKENLTKLEAEARERMEATLKQNTASQKIDERKMRTDETLGEIAGVSRGTIRNTETILTQGTPEDIKQVREAVVNA